MRLFHDKMDQILQRNLACRQEWTRRLPATEMVYTHRPENDEPTDGQFNDEDLGHDVYAPLETLMVTPVQDEGNVTTAPEGNQPTAPSQEIDVEDVPTSQDKRRFSTFTTPSYCQEEIVSQGEPEYPPTQAISKDNTESHTTSESKPAVA